MINNGNDNYLHPYHCVSLPNDCRSIFTDAVIANYASHDQQAALWDAGRARMCRQRRMGWNVAMLIPKIMLWSGVDWFDYTEEGGASC